MCSYFLGPMAPYVIRYPGEYQKRYATFRSFPVSFLSFRPEKISNHTVSTFCTRNIRLLLVCFLGLANSLFNYAQPGKIRFDHLSSRDGLPNNWIYSIHQDQLGYMWFGTKNGLSRYDGSEFINFILCEEENKGLRAYECSHLMEDKKGRVWFINYPHLGCIDSRTLQLEFKVRTNGEPYTFTAMCFDQAGNLYGAEGSAIVRLTLDGKGMISSMDRITDLRTSQINQMAFDQEGDLILVSEEDNTFVLNPETGQVRNFRLPLEPDSVNWPNIVRCVKIDSKNQIWLGSYNRGLYHLDKRTGEFRRYHYDGSFDSKNIVSNMIRGIEESNLDGGESELWLATYDKGLVLFDRETHSFTMFSHDPRNPESLRNNNTRSIKGTSSILWIGTSNGVDKYDIRNQLYRTSILNKELKEEVRKSFTCLEADLNCVENHLVWCGSNGGGLSLYDANSGILTSMPDPDSENILFIQDILHWSPDTLLLACYNGINIYRISEGKYHPIAATVFSNKDQQGVSESSTRAHSIARLDNHSFIFSANFLGFYRYDFITNQTTYLSEIGKRGVHIEPCSEGTFIANTGGSLHHINNKGNVLTTYTSQNESDLFLAGFIYRTTYDAQRNWIWVSSWSGLGRIDLSSGERKGFGRSEGLLHQRTYDVSTDNYGNTWALTEGGISLLPNGASQFKTLRIDHISTLPLAEVPVLQKISTEDLLIAMFNGVVSVDQEQFTHPIKSNFDVQLSAFKTNGSDWIYDVRESINLTHEQNNLEFIISCMSYGDRQGNRFSYLLEGQQPTWVDIGNQNRIALVNIEPGEYTLKVKCTDFYGSESQNIAEVRLTIHPAWYQTLVFNLFLALSIMAIAFFIYKYRIRQVLQLQEIRNNISRDLHDDIGATLSSANITSSVIQRKSQDASQTALIMDLRQQLRDAQQALDDIVWNVNPKNDTLEKMLARMRRYASELLDRSGIAYTIEFPEKTDHVKLNLEYRRDIYLIFKEAINNVAKHSGADQAHIALTYTDHTFVLLIKDNGQGFHAQTQTDRNGLSNMRKRTEAIKGKLQLRTQPGYGCEVELTLHV
jgi:signal transduction histidine kinase/ligand-binding sensor domain-containing protein